MKPVKGVHCRPMQNPLIRKLTGYAPLDDEDTTLIQALCDENVEEFAARRDIISAGDMPDYVHLILEGWAARYFILPDGERQITAFLLPGDFCDLHVTVLRKMDHGIATITPCKVAHLDSKKLDQITTERSMLTKALWWMTLVDEAILRQWIVNVRRNTPAAIAHLLCELHVRLTSLGLVHENRLDLPITQQDLADAAGVTAIHTNRSLQAMRQEGLIELGQRSLFIPDVKRLAEVGGFDDSYLHLRDDSGRRGETMPAADGT